VNVEGIAFIPWYPLATGKLARPGGPVDEIASRHGATPAQVALAWLLGEISGHAPHPRNVSVEAPRRKRWPPPTCASRQRSRRALTLRAEPCTAQYNLREYRRNRRREDASCKGPGTEEVCPRAALRAVLLASPSSACAPRPGKERETAMTFQPITTERTKRWRTTRDGPAGDLRLQDSGDSETRADKSRAYEIRPGACAAVESARSPRTRGPRGPSPFFRTGMPSLPSATRGGSSG
jgi:hypothetical protein